MRLHEPAVLAAIKKTGFIGRAADLLGCKFDTLWHYVRRRPHRWAFWQGVKRERMRQSRNLWARVARHRARADTLGALLATGACARTLAPHLRRWLTREVAGGAMACPVCAACAVTGRTCLDDPGPEKRPRKTVG